MSSWSKFVTVSGRDACYRPEPNNRMSFLVDQENKVVLSCNNNRFSNNRYTLWERINTYKCIRQIFYLNSSQLCSKFGSNLTKNINLRGKGKYHH